MPFRNTLFVLVAVIFFDSLGCSTQLEAMTGLATTAAREQSECDRGTAPLFITSAQATTSSEWNADNFCGSYYYL